MHNGPLHDPTVAHVSLSAQKMYPTDAGAAILAVDSR
jgi:hypothetical protein